MTQEAVIAECMATSLTRAPAWYNCSPAPGRVNGSTSAPVPWMAILHQVCVQMLRSREFKTSSQTDHVATFLSHVSQITRSIHAFRLQRPRLFEALARLFLTKCVYESATRKDATSFVMNQLEIALPKEPPAGCLHYSLDAVQQFLLHSMSHVEDSDDDVDASFLQLLHMLDTFYLSQTAEDPYNSFTSMHWQHSVPWVNYVVELKRVAEMHRYFIRLNASGHQGSAPVNMTQMEVFLRQITQTLQRCVNEDGNDSVAAELFTLYSTERLADPQQLLDDLEKRPKLKMACRKPVRPAGDLLPAASRRVPLPHPAAAAAYTETGSTESADVAALRTDYERLRAEFTKLQASSSSPPSQERPPSKPGPEDTSGIAVFFGDVVAGAPIPFKPDKPLPNGMRQCLDVKKIQEAGLLTNVDFGEPWNINHKNGLVSHTECPMCPFAPWFSKLTECVEYKDLVKNYTNGKPPSKTNPSPPHVAVYHYKAQCKWLKKHIELHVQNNQEHNWMKNPMPGHLFYASLVESHNRQLALPREPAASPPRPGRPPTTPFVEELGDENA